MATGNHLYNWLLRPTPQLLPARINVPAWLADGAGEIRHDRAHVLAPAHRRDQPGGHLIVCESGRPWAGQLGTTHDERELAARLHGVKMGHQCAKGRAEDLFVELGELPADRCRTI